MLQKTIFLGVPPVFNLGGALAKNLKHYGFNIINLSLSPTDFHYQSIWHRLYHTWRKVLWHDHSFKEQLITHWMCDQIHHLMHKHSNVSIDYFLFIAPSFYPLSVLQTINQYANHNIIAYQCDGMNKFPSILESAHLYKKIYAFDPNDLISYPDLPLIGLTNFYFDFIPTPSSHTNYDNKNISAYFLGSHNMRRLASIQLLAKTLSTLDIQSNIYILCRRKNEQIYYHNFPVHLLSKEISIEAQLNKAYQSNILIDIVDPIHQGLSFRIFEALYYRKKLITDNQTVRYYDFYHPDNIYIWDGKSMPELAEFLAKPLHPIDEEIVQKYSFGNWIRQVLDIPPYQTIELPMLPQRK